MTYNYFYKITNLINHKFYYGVHRTSKLNDNYMGSGIAIKHAIRKHGKKNFSKEILLFFKTYDECLAYEALIVNEDMIKDEMCYNLQTGGKGYTVSEETRKKMSISGKGKRKISEEAKQRLSSQRKGVPRSQELKERLSMIAKNMSAETKARISTAKTGTILSDETKRKISLKRKGTKSSDTARLNISNALKGKSHTNEHTMNSVMAKKRNLEIRKNLMLTAHLEKQ